MSNQETQETLDEQHGQILRTRRSLFGGLAKLQAAQSEYSALSTIYGLLLSLRDHHPLVSCVNVLGAEMAKEIPIGDFTEYIESIEKLLRDCKTKKQNFPNWGKDFDVAFAEVENGVAHAKRFVKKHTTTTEDSK